MFNKKLTIIAGAGILIFVIGFGLISGVYTDNPVNDDDENVNCLIPVKTVIMKHNSGDPSRDNFKNNPVTNTDSISDESEDDLDEDDSDDSDDENDENDLDDLDDEDGLDGENLGDDLDDLDDEDGLDGENLGDDLDDEDGLDDESLGDDLDDSSAKSTTIVYNVVYKNISKNELDSKYAQDFDNDSHIDLENDKENSNYHDFEWNGNTYHINLDQFNLTDEELTELFTKCNVSMEKIDNIEALIQEMELSRNNNTLLAIDNLYDYVNNIINNTDFNDLLLSLKDSNITMLNSIFNGMNLLLESIKLEYLDEDFSEVDYLMNNLEILLNEELERYGNLTSQLTEELNGLFEFFDKYPFLRDHTKYYIDFLNYYEFEWNGNIYNINLDQFNLTDEELIELFTKRDVLMEEIANLEFLIQEMELSRNNDILLAIDAIFDSMNDIINNMDFNDLLLSLKDIKIVELNSTFNELKILLESIKLDYPDEDFSEVDYLMNNLEILLNEELEGYESLTSQLKEKLDELFELFEKYPFLGQHTKYVVDTALTSFVGKGYIVPTSSGDDLGNDDENHQVFESDSKGFNTVLAGMKSTGIPYLFVAILVLIIGLFGFGIKRKF